MVLDDFITVALIITAAAVLAVELGLPRGRAKKDDGFRAAPSARVAEARARRLADVAATLRPRR